MSFATAAGSVIMSGPTGIMVPLGIENIPNITLAEVYMLYNYIAVCLMVLIAAFSGARSESRFLIVLPIVGGILFWFGWIHAASQTTFMAFLVLAGLLGVFSYMNDVNHEKHGIGGPGSKLLNIVFFIIIFQAAVGCVNSFDLFGADTAAQPRPNACEVGYTCDTYGNIQLTESIGDLQSSGGLFESILSLVSALPLLALMFLKLMVNIITSITLFSVVLNASLSAVFPGIASNGIYVAFLALMQVGIWGLYAMTLFTWYYKPMPGEGTI